LPILGNLLSLEPQLHLSFTKWGKKYGPVVGVRLGQFELVLILYLYYSYALFVVLFIVISDIILYFLSLYRTIILDDIQTIREAFNLPAFSGRPDLKIFNFLAGGKHGS